MNFILIGEQGMESEHCLSYRKHPSTLSNTFKGLLFYYTTTNPFHCFPILSQTPPNFLHCDLHQNPTHTSKSFIDSSLMAPPGRSYPLHGLILVTVLFIFFLSVLPPKSGGSLLFNTSESLEESKMVIGSKPPTCVNKCMSCRPCMATLVVPNHQKSKGFKALSRGEDDTYYLLSWKCRCGDKLFQP